ncbi:ABC transporter ATP-binding protein [Corynebacterium hansenii]|uniref:ABC transporter ATP-binding protein n=1 Tax=Corynebacterium hansenii TaxID=394964 RepID=A0ABV7ZL85_9CORY|nr:ABC transporter ATP-binding protein [Corynebacterium hansenii]WJY99235.1 Iron import ATP-binding/permease protein IrtB [Corynebacterium hansenii]
MTMAGTTSKRQFIFGALEKAAGTRTGVATLVALYVVSAVLQGVAFVAAIPLVRQLFGGPDAGAGAWAAFGGCVVLAFAAHVIGMVRSARISVYAICDRLLRRIGEKITRIALGWFDASSSAKVSKAMAEDVQTLSHLGPIVLPGLVNGVVTPLTVAVAALFIEPLVGIALFIVIPVGVGCIAWSMRVLERIYALEKQADLRMYGAVLEAAALQPLLRASGRAGMKWDHLAAAVAEDGEAELARMRAEGRPNLVFQIGTQLCFAVALAATAMAAAAGRIDAATFAMLCLLAVRCVEPLTLAVQYSLELFKERESMEAVNGILEAPELPEPDRPEPLDGHDVRFEGVDFGYGGGEPVLREVDLGVASGGIVALVGPSGAGKSTIARLIARFWDVDGGAVRVGGADVRDAGTESLMRNVAFVFQDVYLFDATVLDNIRIGGPGATDGEVRAAARAARLDDVIERLPDGWDTRVGPGGSRLSGGERQRVAIARALLKDAPILLLDEITSALDAENEAALIRTLRDRAERRTVIMIAHRDTVIAAADRVLMVKGGRVREIERN